ncbi:MAG: hypothetical protein ACKPKO_23745 [Candidatus Fonsibacter sp.]
MEIIGEDGKEGIRALNYNAIFTYAVKAIQELRQHSEGSTGANKRTTASDQHHLLMNSATIIL